jgi:ATP/maltotriose-dependent transcriptional regulator MalT
MRFLASWSMRWSPDRRVQRRSNRCYAILIALACGSLAYGAGERSPLARVYDLDGHVLLLGVDHANNTSLHLAEYRASFPGKRWIRQASPLLVPQVTRRLIARFAASAPDPARGRELEKLSERERQVLLGIAQGRSNGLSHAGCSSRKQPSRATSPASYSSSVSRAASKL